MRAKSKNNFALMSNVSMSNPYCQSLHTLNVLICICIFRFCLQQQQYNKMQFTKKLQFQYFSYLSKFIASFIGCWVVLKIVKRRVSTVKSQNQCKLESRSQHPVTECANIYTHCKLSHPVQTALYEPMSSDTNSILNFTQMKL